MKILLPKPISNASFLAGTTIPEVDTASGEVAWIPTGHAYAIDDLVAYSGGIYSCVKAHTSASKTPDKDAVNWLFKSPTNRMAPFDIYLFTKARRPHQFTYQLSGSFIDGIALYGIEADHLHITVQQDGVDLIPPIDVELWEQAFGEWEYLFGNLGRADHYTVTGIPIAPSAVITITLTRNNEDVEAALGYLSIGNWESLVSPMNSSIGAAQYGASVQTKDYGQTIDNADGTYRYIEGRKSKNINLSCVVAASQSPAIDRMLTRIAGLAVAVEISNLPKYSHLSTVGKVTGTVINDRWQTAKVDLQIKGNI